MLEDIRNFLPLSDALLTGGMPTADQLKSAAQAGVKVVINLAPLDAARDLANEGELVESLGMKYINIPVDWESPTRRDFDAFVKAMDENQNNKKLVHCRANYRATGFVTLYRILRLGWKREEAFQDLQQIWNLDEYPVWKKFFEENLKEEEK